MTLFDSAKADRGCRLARIPFPHAPDRASSAGVSDLRAPAAFISESRTPPSVRVPAAPVAPPPATGAVPLRQSSAAVEARAAHNRQVVGSTPTSATNPVANVGEKANGAIAAAFVDPASRDADGADRQQPAASGFTGGDDGRNVEAVGGAASVINLSDASAFILSLVAAHEGRAPDDIVAMLIAGAAEAIGLHALIMRDAADVDLAELPDFARRAANRFRGGGP